LAERLVRLYPREWQDRYGAGLLEAIASRSVTGRELADLLRCALGEWGRAQPDLNPRWRFSTQLQRWLLAIAAGYLAAVGTTIVLQCGLMLFVTVVRWWGGHDPLELLRLSRVMATIVGPSVWFGYALLLSFPLMLFFTLVEVWSNRTRAARAATMLTFAALTAWLPIAGALPLPAPLRLAVAAVSGWTLAMAFFPSTRFVTAHVDTRTP
jgi:hypothetical protein